MGFWIKGPFTSSSVVVNNLGRGYQVQKLLLRHSETRVRDPCGRRSRGLLAEGDLCRANGYR